MSIHGADTSKRGSSPTDLQPTPKRARSIRRPLRNKGQSSPSRDIILPSPSKPASPSRDIILPSPSKPVKKDSDDNNLNSSPTIASSDNTANKCTPKKSLSVQQWMESHPRLSYEDLKNIVNQELHNKLTALYHPL